MKARAVFGVAMLPVVVLAVIALTLTGCLLTGGAVDRGGLLFFGSLSVDNDQGVFAIPETPQQHFRGLRFAASSYPVEVYRVVLVYRGGQEESYAVNWRFTDRVRYHELRVPSDRAVREVRIYQKQPVRPADKHGRLNWKGKGGGDDQRGRGPAGPVTFTVYGVQ
jgi:hypothetical protein